MDAGAGFVTALACIFAVNLLPAFGPPTWALLVFFAVNSDLPAAPLVLGGAACAACGRLVLARASGRLRGRLAPRRLAGLASARDALTANRRRGMAALAVFALSPVPSAQLFIAAGLLGVRLLPLTCAFFSGRLVSYSLYVSGASVAADRLGPTLTGAFRSPVGMALQCAMVLGVIALVRIDWATLLNRRAGARRPRGGAQPTAP